MKVLSVFGTRPEAIKMAPVVLALEAATDIESVVCVSGQHREMLYQVLDVFNIKPDIDMEVMKQAQTLVHITTAVIESLTTVLENEKPDWVLVHGDTTTSMAASIAAYYTKTRVGHVEAGLRTGNIYSPWPEEVNRMITGCIAAANFAPTDGARANLLRENVSPESILVTGNTVIDALLRVRDEVFGDAATVKPIEEAFDYLDSSKRLILVTGHRRESFDGGLSRICDGLARLAERGDVEIVYPVHLNPTVQAAAASLNKIANVHLIPPADYLPFVWLMTRAHLIITDSGGVQEEAPSLGKPVLVTRETTERPEAVEAGVVELVGTDPDLLVHRAGTLLDDTVAYDRMVSAGSPYGDGHAAGRIVDFLKRHNSA